MHAYSSRVERKITETKKRECGTAFVSETKGNTENWRKEQKELEKKRAKLERERERERERTYV